MSSKSKLEITNDRNIKFNWDDIEVGNEQLNHSENFFAQKHIKHERLNDGSEMELERINKQMASAGLQELSALECIAEADKENTASENVTVIKIEKTQTPEKLDIKLPLTNDNATNVANAALTAASIQNNNAPFNMDATLLAAKPPSNIAPQWSTQKRVVTKTVTSAKSAMPPPPHAYKCKDVYQRKKEEALRKRLEEERIQREFHSRPAPNFQSAHEKLKNPERIHFQTIACTPKVLKKSIETEEKRRKKLEEWKRKQTLQFKSRPPSVLKEDPFVPKKTATVLEQRPFRLLSERRGQERKQFDLVAQRTLEDKRKQVETEEDERKRRDEEQFKELRKMTAFKARPNPFK